MSRLEQIAVAFLLVGLGLAAAVAIVARAVDEMTSWSEPRS